MHRVYLFAQGDLSAFIWHVWGLRFPLLLRNNYAICGLTLRELMTLEPQGYTAFTRAI